MEFAWTIAGIIAPMLIGTAWAVLGVAPPKSLLAQGLIVLADVFLAAVSFLWLLIWWRMAAGSSVIRTLLGRRPTTTAPVIAKVPEPADPVSRRRPKPET